MHGVWLDFKQLAAKARNYQKKNVNNTEVMGKHPMGGMLPETDNYKNWSWADKEFMN